MSATIPRLSAHASGKVSPSDAESMRKVGIGSDDDAASFADPALVRSAKWKMDLVVIPLVGMYCEWVPFRRND